MNRSLSGFNTIWRRIPHLCGGQLIEHGSSACPTGHYCVCFRCDRRWAHCGLQRQGFGVCWLGQRASQATRLPIAATAGCQNQLLVPHAWTAASAGSRSGLDCCGGIVGSSRWRWPAALVRLLLPRVLRCRPTMGRIGGWPGAVRHGKLAFGCSAGWSCQWAMVSSWHAFYPVRSAACCGNRRGSAVALRTAVSENPVPKRVALERQ